MYWWLFNHAQELLQAETDCGGEFPWVEMCGDFALAGFILSDGKVVTARTARATWQRVRGELPYVGQADAVIKS
ncbi:hypothetical protein CCR94_01000 [Rhodoblastus sphagnicola]|uniref:Uncharacterized protein n=1 Tax=Rhodoblastus sphagnicola TaxID=333368 RepID=A0A2S6NG95_9HYPH|nr:hypothetical protein CCR94_01000 [Rhodoblastus sphagnicola]